MLIHRLAAAQGCLLSSDINIGEAPRETDFYFFDLMVGEVGHMFSSVSLTVAIPLGSQQSCLGLTTPCFMDSRAGQLLGRLEVPAALVGASPHWVSRGGFACTIQDLASDKRPQWDECYLCGCA